VGDPLLGFGPPTRYVPKPPPLASRPQATLLGFSAPTAHEEKGIHVSPVARRAPRFCRGIRQRVPTHRLRCRSQVFSTSQRPSSSLHRPAVFRQVALLGFCPSGVFHPRSPGSSSQPACPPDVHPSGWPSPILGEGASGRACQYLGLAAGAIGRLQGLHPRGSRPASPRHD